jgi:hypothetical protein
MKSVKAIFPHYITYGDFLLFQHCAPFIIMRMSLVSMSQVT